MDESQKKQALIASLRLLSATPKSRQEMTKRLLDKGYSAEVVAAALDDLEKQGVLNDRSFAENLKSRYLNSKPSGSRKIDFELKRRGIPDSLRRGILEELDPEQERLRALEIGLARWEKLGKVELEKRKKRVFDFLMRRGFDYPLVTSLIEEFQRNES